MKIKPYHIIAGAVMVPFLTALFYYLLFLNHVSLNECGIAYNSITGEVTVQDHAGWYRTGLTTKVMSINTLPFLITLHTQANVINTRLVRFRPEGAREFIKVQGFSYWTAWNLNNIMTGFAFSGREYPFLEVQQSNQAEKNQGAK